MRLSNKAVRLKYKTWGRVSILVLMDAPLEFSLRVWVLPKAIVSILVLMDAPLEWIEHAAKWSEQIEFQSLF